MHEQGILATTTNKELNEENKVRVRGNQLAHLVFHLLEIQNLERFQFVNHV